MAEDVQAKSVSSILEQLTIVPKGIAVKGTIYYFFFGEYKDSEKIISAVEKTDIKNITQANLDHTYFFIGYFKEYPGKDLDLEMLQQKQSLLLKTGIKTDKELIKKLILIQNEIKESKHIFG